jgi:hypothetical protein
MASAVPCAETALPRHFTDNAPGWRRAIYPAAEGKHCKIGWPIREFNTIDLHTLKSYPTIQVH